MKLGSHGAILLPVLLCRSNPGKDTHRSRQVTAAVTPTERVQNVYGRNQSAGNVCNLTESAENTYNHTEGGENTYDHYGGSGRMTYDQATRAEDTYDHV